MSKSPPDHEPPSASPDVENEEVGHLDDTVIGRAFKWSLIAFLLVAVGAAAVMIYINRRPAAAKKRVTELKAPVARSSAVVEIPDARFTDITAEAGITFVHNNGAYGEKLLPETMGGGVAFLDFDHDGDQDLLFVNSTYWPWKIPPGKKLPTMGLYRNTGQGRFEDATPGSGLDVSFYGMGAAVGDYDNDGLVDVFISAVGHNHLFRNMGNGKFADVAASAGVAGISNQWSTACAWFDLENDGDLDLFVGNYVTWSKEVDLEVGYKVVGLGRAYGQPMNFAGTFPSLYRNEGGGRFTDISKEAGMQVQNPATGVPMAKTLGVAPVDLDSDGWMDLVVANDTVQNFVFHNQRNGTFKEIGAISGIAFDSYGNTRGAMGIDAGYYRNDSALGISIGNFANEMTALYVSQKDPLTFTDEAIPEGIGPASRLPLKFGVFFFDYDLDGRLDLLTANGHLEEEIGKLQKSQQYAQSAQLFWNAGTVSGPGFISVPDSKAGKDLFKPILGRDSAFADIDGDGDLDAVLTQIGGPPLLLRNDQALEHRWLRLSLAGSSSNRSAIGARVLLKIGGATLQRQVMPTRSYLSQSELPITIGLGRAAKVDTLEIIWPGANKQSVANPSVNQVIQVVERK